ncbi:MAG: hypothetical protein Q4G69_06840, partial [Planctomycetia bacterium]|nr:hypothetical protein [Planctomycetia bacterium]
MINQNKKYVSDAYNGTIVELSFENRDLANEGHYALPTAVNGIPGAVKPDNQTLVVDADGTLSVNTDRIPLLSEGILPSSVVPAVAISSVHVVDSEEAMLALAGAEEGDVAIRSDLNKTFILSVSDPGSYADLANWKEILTSSNTILSVNGQTGAVALDAEDVGAAPAVHTHSSLTDGTNTLSIPAKSGTIATTDDIPVVPPAPAIPTIAAGSNGNFAALDGSGNIIDSEYVSGDFETAGSITLHDGLNTAHSALFAAKADTVHAHSSLTDGTNTLSIPAKSGTIATTDDIPVVPPAPAIPTIAAGSNGNFAALDGSGNIIDSEYVSGDFETAGSITLHDGLNTAHSALFAAKADTVHAHSSLTDGTNTLSIPAKSGVIATTEDIPWINQKANDRQIVMYSGETTYGQKSLGSSGIDATELQSAMLTIRNGIVTPISLQTSLMNKSDTSHTHSSLVNNGYTLTAPVKSGTIATTADIIRPIVLLSVPTGTALCCTPGTEPVMYTGDRTLTGVSTNNICRFNLKELGDHTFFIRGGKYKTFNIDCVKLYRFSFADVYGAMIDDTQSDPSLTRLEDAVGKTFTPQIGAAQEGASDFDALEIYKDIKLCNLVDGEVAYYEGDAGFSRTPASGDVMVEIPKFYYKIDKTETDKTKILISAMQQEGYSISPAH